MHFDTHMQQDTRAVPFLLAAAQRSSLVLMHGCTLFLITSFHFPFLPKEIVGINGIYAQPMNKKRATRTQHPTAICNGYIAPPPRTAHTASHTHHTYIIIWVCRIFFGGKRHPNIFFIFFNTFFSCDFDFCYFYTHRRRFSYIF